MPCRNVRQFVDFSGVATIGDYDFVGSETILFTPSQWKAHLLEEGGVTRIALEPFEVRLAFQL